MNHDKILLEMLGRIKDLEEKVESLEEFRERFESEDDVDDESGRPEGDPRKRAGKNAVSGRNKARLEITKILTDKYGFSVRKAYRDEGSGLVATRNGKSCGIKVSYSRSFFEYVNEDLQCTGWHSVTKKDVENANAAFYVFVVEGENDLFHYFIFTRNDLLDYCFSETDSPTKKTHLYFRVSRSGRPYEARDDMADMSRHYNNWSIIAG
ncbi:MAG: hypothetical protein LBS70_06370 [Candidatus Accumulibacter sp.]|jgi:hypothetical protein|nr:hypothetical protein [Accumulibacter sp.]